MEYSDFPKWTCEIQMRRTKRMPDYTSRPGTLVIKREPTGFAFLIANGAERPLSGLKPTSRSREVTNRIWPTSGFACPRPSVDTWKLGFSPLWKLLTLVTNRPETLLLCSSLMELAPKLDQGRFTPKSTKTNRTHIYIFLIRGEEGGLLFSGGGALPG